ncbi:hypothetical protein JTB14_034324 [Gonioctena quinquepunctata]|nr:hypothetical protein JTB14_034324 [Gonioctena quinquepunctata]
MIIKTILNDCLEQLYILRNINARYDISFSEEAVEYVSIKNRYMGVENHGDNRLGTCSSNYEKLANDINTIMKMVKNCCEELIFRGTFDSLNWCIDAIKRMEKDDEQLLQDKKENEKKIELLRNQCEEERLNNIRTIEETNAKIQKLRFEVEDAIVYGKYEMIYFTNWEKARQEQNVKTCSDKENIHETVIIDTSNQIDLENGTHAELGSYIAESKNDYADEIQYWMKHYDEEIEWRETEMLNLKTDLEDITVNHISIKKTYETRIREMEDWEEYKRIKKEKEKQLQLEIWAAMKIQAWWRGVMFRRKLGPYKHLKGKKKDKKKNKKKKR